MTRTMLNDNSTSMHFWVETVNATCYLQNIITTKKIAFKDDSIAFHDGLQLSLNPTFHDSF